MSKIKDTWNEERLAYQRRYAEACKKYKESQEKAYTESSQGEYKGAMLEMSWVLIGIFGLSGRQVDEVEKNDGFTNTDIEFLLYK